MESKPEPVNGFYILTLEQFRQAIIDASPKIAHDTEVITDLLRELVKVERARSGLDKNGGILLLHPRHKKAPTDPDLVGGGQIAGHYYRASAWLKPDKEVLKISLLEPSNLSPPNER